MHLRVPFVLDFFVLSIFTLVSFINGQEVWPSNNNANRRTRLDPGMGFATGYQPSGRVMYNLGQAMPNFNYRESSYGLQSRSDFSLPFNKPGGYASSSKFSEEASRFNSTAVTSAQKPVDFRYKFYDWVTKFGTSSNNRNGFNLPQDGGNSANSELGNVPINVQNSGFSNGNVDLTTSPGGTVPVSNRNVFNSGSWNDGAMKTPGNEQSATFNNGPLSNVEANAFSVDSVASPGNIGSDNFPIVMNDGLIPSKERNNQVFAFGVPFNSKDITSENSQFDKTATPDRPIILNTSDEEIYKILSESNSTTEVQKRKKAPKKKKPGKRTRSRSKNRSKTKDSRPKFSSGSDAQNGKDTINGQEYISTASPETSSVPAKKDLPSFLSSALNKFDTPSTVHYISSAASLLVSDDEFDLATLPAVILGLTMQIRSSFPGMSNCELLNQVFLQLIIALGHILKQSKMGDVNFDNVADTAELVMKSF